MAETDPTGGGAGGVNWSLAVNLPTTEGKERAVEGGAALADLGPDHTLVAADHDVQDQTQVPNLQNERQFDIYKGCMEQFSGHSYQTQETAARKEIAEGKETPNEMFQDATSALVKRNISERTEAKGFGVKGYGASLINCLKTAGYNISKGFVSLGFKRPFASEAVNYVAAKRKEIDSIKTNLTNLQKNVMDPNVTKLSVNMIDRNGEAMMKLVDLEGELEEKINDLQEGSGDRRICEKALHEVREARVACQLAIDLACELDKVPKEMGELEQGVLKGKDEVKDNLNLGHAKRAAFEATGYKAKTDNEYEYQKEKLVQAYGLRATNRINKVAKKNVRLKKQEKKDLDNMANRLTNPAEAKSRPYQKDGLRKDIGLNSLAKKLLADTKFSKSGVRALPGEFASEELNAGAEKGGAGCAARIYQGIMANPLARADLADICKYKGKQNSTEETRKLNTLGEILRHYEEVTRENPGVAIADLDLVHEMLAGQIESPDCDLKQACYFADRMLEIGGSISELHGTEETDRYKNLEVPGVDTSKLTYTAAVNLQLTGALKKLRKLDLSQADAKTKLMVAVTAQRIRAQLGANIDQSLIEGGPNVEDSVLDSFVEYAKKNDIAELEKEPLLEKGLKSALESDVRAKVDNFSKSVDGNIQEIHQKWSNLNQDIILAAHANPAVAAQKEQLRTKRDAAVVAEFERIGSASDNKIEDADSLLSHIQSDEHKSQYASLQSSPEYREAVRSSYSNVMHDVNDLVNNLAGEPASQVQQLQRAIDLVGKFENTDALGNLAENATEWKAQLEQKQIDIIDTALREDPSKLGELLAVPGVNGRVNGCISSHLDKLTNSLPSASIMSLSKAEGLLRALGELSLSQGNRGKIAELSQKVQNHLQDHPESYNKKSFWNKLSEVFGNDKGAENVLGIVVNGEVPGTSGLTSGLDRVNKRFATMAQFLQTADYSKQADLNKAREIIRFLNAAFDANPELAEKILGTKAGNDLMNSLNEGVKKYAKEAKLPEDQMKAEIYKDKTLSKTEKKARMSAFVNGSVAKKVFSQGKDIKVLKELSEGTLTNSGKKTKEQRASQRLVQLAEYIIDHKEDISVEDAREIARFLIEMLDLNPDLTNYSFENSEKKSYLVGDRIYLANEVFAETNIHSSVQKEIDAITGTVEEQLEKLDAMERGPSSGRREILERKVELRLGGSDASLQDRVEKGNSRAADIAGENPIIRPGGMGLELRGEFNEKIDGLFPPEVGQSQHPKTQLNKVIKETLETEVAYIIDLGKVINNLKGLSVKTVDSKEKEQLEKMVDDLNAERELHIMFFEEIRPDREGVDSQEQFYSNLEAGVQLMGRGSRISLQCVKQQKLFPTTSVGGKVESMWKKSFPEEAITFQSYLIKPVQRAGKYPLLFRELSKNIPEDQPGRDGVIRSFEKSTDTVININEAVREMEKKMAK